MSAEELQEDIISELELQNDGLLCENHGLRYQLSLHASRHGQPSSNTRHQIQDLLAENDALRKEIVDLDAVFRRGKQVMRERETAVRRLLEQFRIPESVLEDIRYDIFDEVAVLKEQIVCLEGDIAARDEVIGELEADTTDLRQKYAEACSEADTISYVLNNKISELESRVAESDQEVAMLTHENLATREAERMYNELVVRYSEQTQLNDELNDKLTATEFDLYATVETLDLLEISGKSSGVCTTAHTASIGLMTDFVAALDSAKLSSELIEISDKYETSQCHVSELVIDNAALECHIAELEQSLSFYRNQIMTANSTINRGSSQRLPTDLAAEIKEITTVNGLLCNRLISYEDQILDLADQLLEIVIETDLEADIKVIVRKLHSIVQKQESFVQQNKIGMSCIP